MVLVKLPIGALLLTLGALVLETGTLSAQGYGGFSPTFGATGLAPGSYGTPPHLSLGISGGGGGYGSLGGVNRFGRLTRREREELDNLLGRGRPGDNVAHLRVLLPAGNAELWVNEALMKKQGKSRSFISPFLMPGKNFVYELKARFKDKKGRIVERTRSVMIHAGSQEIVDFTEPSDFD